jgi:hypothetical protein
MKKWISLLLLLIAIQIYGQDTVYKSLEIGLRTKKYAGFYWENGITAEFYSAKITGKIPLTAGFNLTFTKLGSAFQSNALSMTNADVYFAYYFNKHKHLIPTTRLNIGYVHTNLGEYFSNHDFHNNAMVLGLEAGISYLLPYNLNVLVTGGMNFFVANENKNLGSSIYPVFGQISLLYTLKKVYR